jgi:ABC-type amino acid transport substrate-binding protein
MNNIIDATAALKSNIIDAVVFEHTSLQAIAKQNPDLELIKEAVQLLDVAVAVNKAIERHGAPIILNRSKAVGLPAHLKNFVLTLGFIVLFH